MRAVGSTGKRRRSANAALVEIFGDHAGPGYDRPILFHQHRRPAGGIEREEFGAPLMHALFDEGRFDSIFGKRQADEARMRIKRMMIEKRHSRGLGLGIAPADSLGRIW